MDDLQYAQNPRNPNDLPTIHDCLKVPSHERRGGNRLLSRPDGWRWMLVSSAVPAVMILMVRATIPEATHCHVGKGRHDEALTVLRKTLGEGINVEGITAHDPSVAKLCTVKAFKNALTGGYLNRAIFISIVWTCTITALFRSKPLGRRCWACSVSIPGT
ncbi:MFS transporter [Arthrobacter sp. STN4]|uniref:MFS transporter n=1 Tax=Arthrobacter sp. STN4 TaxID=2923276 RepID=UPI002119EEEF|nr:MFS transporter [Arthrobacter sp. STN4]MCQ9165974.1 MFS transporter [Arthrobacter sp. STN4]